MMTLLSTLFRTTPTLPFSQVNSRFTEGQLVKFQTATTRVDWLQTCTAAVAEKRSRRVADSPSLPSTDAMKPTVYYSSEHQRTMKWKFRALRGNHRQHYQVPFSIWAAAMAIRTHTFSNTLLFRSCSWTNNDEKELEVENIF